MRHINNVIRLYSYKLNKKYLKNHCPLVLENVKQLLQLNLQLNLQFNYNLI